MLPQFLAYHGSACPQRPLPASVCRFLPVAPGNLWSVHPSVLDSGQHVLMLELDSRGHVAQTQHM